MIFAVLVAALGYLDDPNCAAKPFLRFEGDGTKPNFSYEAGFTVKHQKGEQP